LDSKRKKHRYIKGLDGLRAIAVMGVILYHLFPAIIPGGFLGVPLFFVISGYLITDLLIFEYRQNGQINIGSFYCRRIKRLYPALVTTLMLTATYITLFAPNLMHGLRGAFWSNIIYIYNWWEIGHGQSYFDRFKGESPFTHLWSLSIEGQYYLIWPLIVLASLKFAKNRARRILVFWGMIGASAFSAASMRLLYNPDNISRVYYGSDTRMFSILLGASLAFVWSSEELTSEITPIILKMGKALGWAALLAVIWAFLTMEGQGDFTYAGGMYIFSIVTMLLVATVGHPSEPLGGFLNNPVMNWIGTRSYGIYLYQLPIMVFYEQLLPHYADQPLLHGQIRLIIILAIAELSYRFLETPMRYYDYNRLKRPVHVLKSWFQDPLAVRSVAIAAVAIYLCGATATGLCNKNATSEVEITQLQKDLEKDQQEVDIRNAAIDRENNFTRVVQIEKISSEADALKKLSPAQKKLIKRYPISASTYLAVKDIPLTIVGDSISLDIAPAISRVMPHTYVDGKVSRQVYQTPPVFASLKRRGRLARNVLIVLGTNGPIPSKPLRKILDTIGPDRHIYWANIKIVESWEKQTNLFLQKLAREHKNITIIDWKSASTGKRSWFTKDREHPNRTGSRAYARLVFEAIKKQVGGKDKLKSKKVSQKQT
jgi:peptidoglycan/LPS O-acetylase OafA/YrhL